MFKLNQLVSLAQIEEAGFNASSVFDLPIDSLRKRINAANDIRDFCAALVIASKTVLEAHFYPSAFNINSGAPKTFRVVQASPLQKRFEFSLPVRDSSLYGARLSKELIECLNQFTRLPAHGLLPLMYQFHVTEPMPDLHCVVLDSCLFHSGDDEYVSGLRFTVVHNVIEVSTNSSLTEA